MLFKSFIKSERIFWWELKNHASSVTPNTDSLFLQMAAVWVCPCCVDEKEVYSWKMKQNIKISDKDLKQRNFSFFSILIFWIFVTATTVILLKR